MELRDLLQFATVLLLVYGAHLNRLAAQDRKEDRRIQDQEKLAGLSERCEKVIAAASTHSMSFRLPAGGGPSDEQIQATFSQYIRDASALQKEIAERDALDAKSYRERVQRVSRIEVALLEQIQNMRALGFAFVASPTPVDRGSAA